MSGSLDGLDDLALIQAHAAGDLDAFGVLFTRHRDRLWAVALRTTGNPEDAADALQEAMISAFKRAAEFRAEAMVTTWLHRIVVNASLDRLRRNKVRAAQPLPDDLDDLASRGAVLASTSGADDPAQAAVRSDQRSAVLRALDTLPADQKAALVLVDMEGYPVEEAARMLGCPAGTVKSRCARGRQRLAGLLAAGHGNRRWDRRVRLRGATARGCTMTDQPQDDAIRALLRDARATEPIPADVAARLDATLAGLTDRTTTAEDPAPVATVLPFRRRLAPRLLAAAAVIAIVGVGAVGVNQVLQGTSGSDDRATADSAAAGSQAEGADLDEDAPGVASPEAPTPADGLTGTLDNLSALRLFKTNTVPVLTTADFATQAETLDLVTLNQALDARAASGTTKDTAGSPAPKPAAAAPGYTMAPTPSPVPGLQYAAESGTDSLLRSAARSAARSCTGPGLKQTTAFPIVLDGAAAVLVVHPATGTDRLVQAWSCDGSRLLAATTLPR